MGGPWSAFWVCKACWQYFELCLGRVVDPWKLVLLSKIESCLKIGDDKRSCCI